MFAYILMTQGGGDVEKKEAFSCMDSVSLYVNILADKKSICSNWVTNRSTVATVIIQFVCW